MKKSLKISLFIIIMFIGLFITSKVNAANATATITASKKEVEIGESVTLSVNIKAASWSLTASGDGISTKKYADVTSDGMVGNKTETITLDTSKEGTKTITLKGTVSEPSGEGTEKTSIDTSVTVIVKPKAQEPTPDPTPDPKPDPKPDPEPEPTPDPEPTKGTVSLCRINGIKVNQYLNVKNKESVSVQVDTSTKEGLKIYNDKTKMTYNAKSGQTINVQIVEGEQTLTITLDTGYKTTRRIISTKEGEETPPNVIEEPKQEEKVILKSLSLKGVNGEEKVDFALEPEFSSEVYEYTLNIPKEQNDITKLEIEAIADKEEFTVEITGNENLVDGENIVTILVKSKDGEKTTEYKIKVNKEAKVVEAVTTPVIDETLDTEEDNLKQMIKIAIVGFVTLIAVAGIAFAVIEYKYGKKKEEKASFASVGFENDDNEKEDVLESLRTNSYEDVEEDLKDSAQENTEIKAAETITNYEPTYTSKFDNFDNKEESTERVVKSRRTEKSSKTRARRAKVKDEEFEDVEETFEVLKEEDTASRKRGKHF